MSDNKEWQDVVLSDEMHLRYAGWMLKKHLPLDKIAFNAARANMGTTSEEQDAALYRSILAYVAAARVGMEIPAVTPAMVRAFLSIVGRHIPFHGGDVAIKQGIHAAMLAAAEAPKP